MANVYKLKQKNGALSKRNYTLGGARAVRKKLENKGIETKIIKYKEDIVIADTTSNYTGIIEFYRYPNEAEYKQMQKAKNRSKA